MIEACLHKKSAIDKNHPLAGKRVYVPIMDAMDTEVFVACLHRFGIDARLIPPSNAETLELGGKYTGGDECYPAKITVGDFMRVATTPGFDSQNTVFVMVSADGPCRFGQYTPYLQKILRENGFGQVRVIAPSDNNGYAEFGAISGEFYRLAWRALVATGVLKKALLNTRPYETLAGRSDQVCQECLQDLCQTVLRCCGGSRCQMQSLVGSLARAHQRFKQIPVAQPDRPLIGVVGEIYCRLNTFSNEDLVRKVEALGGEVWLSGMLEYAQYADESQVMDLLRVGERFSLDMAKLRLRIHLLHADERALCAPFEELFSKYPEPTIRQLFELARPYLPPEGAIGEMVLSVGKAAYLARQGADGIIDISPFTCMNGIVSEAIYPKLSRDYGGIPIRNFYFDGTQSDLERDVGIYLELARTYRSKKKYSNRPHVGFLQKARRAVAGGLRSD